jgi:hypothetical protein
MLPAQKSLAHVPGVPAMYVLTTMTVIMMSSKRTRNAIAQEAPHLEFSLSHCTCVQYSFGSITEFNRIRLETYIYAPAIHNGKHKNPHQKYYTRQRGRLNGGLRFDKRARRKGRIIFRIHRGLHRETTVSTNQRLCIPVETAGQRTRWMERVLTRTRGEEAGYRRGSQADNDAKGDESRALTKRVFEAALAGVLSANSFP